MPNRRKGSSFSLHLFLISLRRYTCPSVSASDAQMYTWPYAAYDVVSKCLFPGHVENFYFYNYYLNSYVILVTSSPFPMYYEATSSSGTVSTSSKIAKHIKESKALMKEVASLCHNSLSEAQMIAYMKLQPRVKPRLADVAELEHKSRLQALQAKANYVEWWRQQAEALQADVQAQYQENPTPQNGRLLGQIISNYEDLCKLCQWSHGGYSDDVTVLKLEAIRAANLAHRL